MHRPTPGVTCTRHSQYIAVKAWALVSPIISIICSSQILRLAGSDTFAGGETFSLSVYIYELRTAVLVKLPSLNPQICA